jgi:NADH dehydrogenase
VFGALVDRVRRLPAVPALLPAPRVQPIHVDDLAEGLLRAAEREDLPAGAYNLAAETPISFTVFLRAIAAHRLRRRRVFLPVPVAALEFAFGLAGAAFAGERERLRSLTRLQPLATGEHLATLGLRLRTLDAGMHPSGDDRRRRLLREGRSLQGYVLGSRAPPGLVARYARAVETVRDGRPLSLPRWVLRWPLAIAALDDRALLEAAGAVELAWRLDAASTLAEASPAGARAFLDLGGGSTAVTAAARIALVLVAEVFWRLVRAALRRPLRRALDGVDA